MKLLLCLSLLVSSSAGAQKLNYLDCIRLIEGRNDTAQLFRSLAAHGFDVKGRYTDSIIVFYSKKEKNLKDLAERVVLYYNAGEVWWIEYRTNRASSYESIKKELLDSGEFIWLPMTSKGEEKNEGFGSPRYLVLGSIDTRLKYYTFTISLRSSEHTFPF